MFGFKNYVWTQNVKSFASILKEKKSDKQRAATEVGDDELIEDFEFKRRRKGRLARVADGTIHVTAKTFKFVLFSPFYIATTIA